MSGQWKADDVRLATVNGERMLVLRGRGIFQGQWFTQGPVAGSRLSVTESWLIDEHPLVVIDPEDREQVERLLLGYAGWKGSDKVDDNYVYDMQAALREFASPTPPRPEEPQGLGAVVEDEEGARWIKIDLHSNCNDWVDLGAHKWTPTNGERETIRHHYRDITAVRVLSEGVVQS